MQTLTLRQRFSLARFLRGLGPESGPVQLDRSRIFILPTATGLLFAIVLLVMLLGVGSDLAIKTAIVYLVAHAFYKASLFMVAGNVDHETGTRDVTVLGGLRRLMPLTALAGLLAALYSSGYLTRDLIADIDHATVAAALRYGAKAAAITVSMSTAPRGTRGHDRHSSPTGPTCRDRAVQGRLRSLQVRAACQ